MDRKGLILLVYVNEECNVSHIKQKPDSLSFKILNDILSRCVALRCVTTLREYQVQKIICCTFQVHTLTAEVKCNVTHTAFPVLNLKLS